MGWFHFSPLVISQLHSSRPYHSTCNPRLLHGRRPRKGSVAGMPSPHSSMHCIDQHSRHMGLVPGTTLRLSGVLCNPDGAALVVHAGSEPRYICKPLSPPPCQRACCSTRVWMTGGQAMGGVEQHHVRLCRFRVTMHRDRCQTPTVLFPADHGSGDPTKRRKYLGLHRFHSALSVQISSAWLIGGQSFSSFSHHTCNWRLHIVSRVRCRCLVSCCTSPVHSSSDSFKVTLHCRHDLCKASLD